LSKWGASHVTLPVDGHVVVDDALWYDRGCIPRRFWWDDTCESAKRSLRVAERLYRSAQAKVTIDKQSADAMSTACVSVSCVCFSVRRSRRVVSSDAIN
jgi:hypothetical protein